MLDCDASISVYRILFKVKSNENNECSRKTIGFFKFYKQKEQKTIEFKSKK